MFLSYSLHNNLIDEKFIKFSEQKIGKKKNSIYGVINLIVEELFLFFNFIQTFDNSFTFQFNKFDLKKFLFRVILLIVKQVDFITIEKQLVFKERNAVIKYTNFIQYTNFIKPKSLFSLFKVSKAPAFIKNYKNIFLIGFFHYTSNFYVISKKDFKPASIPTLEFINTLERYGQTGYFFDKEMVDIIDKQLNIIEKNNIEFDLKKLNLQNILKNKEITNFSKDEDLTKLYSRLNVIKHKIKNAQKELTLNIDTWVFREFKKKFENNQDPIYFIPYADFRGRFYLKSFISPQNSWLYRFSYFFGFKKNIKQSKDFLLYINKQLEEKIKLLGFSDINKAAWIFLSVGFKFKTEIPLEKFSINLDKLIWKGIEEYCFNEKAELELFNKFSKNIDACEIIYYFKILNDLKSKNNYYKDRFIIKDTTASVYQHLGKLLTFRDLNSLQLNNLTSETAWFDTYEPILERLRSHVDSTLQKFFTRQSLKKIIMTTKYNIEFKSALKYFNEEIGYIHDYETYKSILKEFSKIFRLLKNGVIENEILFKTPLKEFNKIISKYRFLKLNDINIDLTYLVIKKKEICVFLEKNRHILANYETLGEIDSIKMEIAALPNIIHALDALYARRIINLFTKSKKKIFTIHDAFAISTDDIELLITVAWKAFDIEEIFTFINAESKEATINNFNIQIKPKSLSIII